MSTGILGYIAIMAVFFLTALLVEDHLERKKKQAVKLQKTVKAALY